jgi:hypothetical protein
MRELDLFCISSCSLDSEDSNGQLWLQEMIPDLIADLEAGSRRRKSSEINDKSDDDDNVSHDGPPSPPIHAFSIDDDSFQEYERNITEDGFTEQTHSSWIIEMRPDSAEKEAGTRHNMCEFDDSSENDENDSQDGLPSMPKQNASMDDDSLDGYDSKNTDDKLDRQTASIAAPVAQTSQ